jgi:hypothetical protein
MGYAVDFLVWGKTPTREYFGTFEEAAAQAKLLNSRMTGANALVVECPEVMAPEEPAVEPVMPAKSLFKRGDFTLHGGGRSAWKIDCDELTDGDIECLAYMIRQIAGQYIGVEGIPRGGLRLAEALAPYATQHDVEDGPRPVHLLVDDVLTTGGSMRRCRAGREAAWRAAGDRGMFIFGVVIFARGPCPYWVCPLFQMPESLWLKSADEPLRHPPDEDPGHRDARASSTDVYSSEKNPPGAEE